MTTTTATITRDEIKAALEIMIAVAKAIEELKSVREGYLYATMAGHMTCTAFDAMIRQIVNTGLVRRDGSTLVWVG